MLWRLFFSTVERGSYWKRFCQSVSSLPEKSVSASAILSLAASSFTSSCCMANSHIAS